MSRTSNPAERHAEFAAGWGSHMNIMQVTVTRANPRTYRKSIGALDGIFSQFQIERF
jgi:hypothetical protein